MRTFMTATLALVLGANVSFANCRAELVDLAAGLCAEFVGLSGSRASEKYSGQIEARLPGLMKKLVDVGGEVGAAVERERYENILRADIPRVLQEGRECRLEVARLFYHEICAAPAAAAAAARQPPPTAAMPEARVDPRFAARAVISDPDGYTNVRSGRGTQFQVIGRVVDGEVFWTSVQDDPWWQIRTADGAVGYMHRSRVRLID